MCKTSLLEDVPYRTNADVLQRMDVLLPDVPNGKAVFYIHGGGWYDGDKTAWRETARYMCEHGYVCASINYRLTANGDAYPSQIEDARHAMAFFRSKANEYRFDPARIAAAGSSAGGHLAAMLATIAPDDDVGVTPELLTRHTRPNAVVTYSTVFTVMPLPDDKPPPDNLDFYVNKAMGGTFEEVPEVYKIMSPIERLDRDTPPFFIIHGVNDDTVPVGRAIMFKRYMDATRLSATLELMEDAPHGFCYGMETAIQQQAAARALAFLEKTL